MLLPPFFGKFIEKTVCLGFSIYYEDSLLVIIMFSFKKRNSSFEELNFKFHLYGEHER